MKTLLFLTSSLFGENSKSTQVASEFVSAWKAANGPAKVNHRDLANNGVPHLTGEHIAAWMTAPAERSDRQQAVASESDPLLEEVEAADVIVIAAPMYNFSISSPLKAWIDHITRAGRTFQYTENGPQGLLRNKKVFVVTARGGVYTGDSPAKAYDFQEPYLRAILGFNGLTDVTFIHVEAQKMDPEAAEAAIASARAAAREAAAPARAAA
ncbi:MAG TPA: FMN-dependent NADH-azoreductase [Rhizomicrobium sp.]|nr:FMN-dependent NADH-azoreductase [Rhizomicrobium sp.]